MISLRGKAMNFRSQISRLNATPYEAGEAFIYQRRKTVIASAAKQSQRVMAEIASSFHSSQ